MLLGYAVTLAKKGRVLSSQPEILAVNHSWANTYLQLPNLYIYC